MISNYLKIVVLGAVLLLLVGCKSEKLIEPVDIGMTYEEAFDKDTELTEVQIPEDKLEEAIETSVPEVELSVYDQLDLVYDFESKDSVRILKISPDKYLVSYMEIYYHNTNYPYSIYDFKNKTRKDIQLESFYGMMIDDIFIEGSNIRLYSDGSNVVNGFKDFPSSILFDMETGLEVGREAVYWELGRSFEVRQVGYSMNETMLDSITEEDGEVEFHFGETKNTVMAGGDFCPQITVASHSIGTVTICISELVYSVQQFDQLVESELIESYNISDFEDGYGNKLTTIALKVKDVSTYTGYFVGGNEGFLNMVIKFE
jgi:hypothetical protein